MSSPRTSPGTGARRPIRGARRRSATRPSRPVSREAARLAGVLRARREAAGLSQRALAQRMGVSWVTVSEAERGRDPRFSTMRAYLEALPELSASEVLLGHEADAPADMAGAWSFYRNLFGFSAAVIAKEVTIGPRGDGETVIEARGIRPHRGDLRDPRLRTALARAACLGSSAVIRRIAFGEAGPLAGRVEYRDGDAVHELVFPADLQRKGMTYRLRQSKPGLFSDDAREGIEAAREGPFVHGTSLAVTWPVERLRIAVRFPPGRRPQDVRSYAWPSTLVPDQDDPDLLRRLQPHAMRVTWSASRRTLAATLRRPLLELHYGLGWGSW